MQLGCQDKQEKQQYKDTSSHIAQAEMHRGIEREVTRYGGSIHVKTFKLRLEAFTSQVHESRKSHYPSRDVVKLPLKGNQQW